MWRGGNLCVVEYTIKYFTRSFYELRRSITALTLSTCWRICGQLVQCQNTRFSSAQLSEMLTVLVKLSVLLYQHMCGSNDSYPPFQQKKLSDVGFKLVPGLLVDCGLPDVRLWYNTVKRGAHTLPTVKAILHEIGEVRAMRKQNPGNTSKQGVAKRCG